MIINCIFSIPAATDPAEVVDVMWGSWDTTDPDNPVWVPGAGFKTSIPGGGIMPLSAVGAGKHLVHAQISGATYAEILDVTSTQRPVWQIFGAQDAFKTPNPDYDPEDPESELTVLVIHKAMNASVWNFLPDRNGRQQTELHAFQGDEPWPER